MKNSSNFVDTKTGLTTTIVSLLPVNQNRTALVIMNTGTTYINIGFSTDKLIPIPPKDGIKFNEIVPVNAIYGNADTTGTVVIWEG